MPRGAQRTSRINSSGLCRSNGPQLRGEYMSRFFASSSVRARRQLAVAALAGVASVVGFAGIAGATPYASNVVVSGTNVSFTLNEAADWVTVSINGGAPQQLATNKGTIFFGLN